MKDLPMKTLLTPDEVAKFFSVSKQTVYNWCADGTVASCKPNGVLRVYRASVMKLMQAATKNKSEKKQKQPPGWVKNW